MGKKKLTAANGRPIADNQNSQTAGQRGPVMLQDPWLIEKLAHFDREVIPERRMHAKGSGAYGTFTVTHDITKYTRAALFSRVGKQTECFVRFSTVAGERGAADAERDIRGFAIKFYTEEGNWDLVGNNTPVFFLRDPLKFPDLNHAVKRDPHTNMRSANTNWDFWTLLPEALHQVTITMSPRGIPYSYRHMNGYGSHTYSFLNAENKRIWVKFHLKTMQGIKCLTDGEAEAIIARDRESHQRDLFESIGRQDFPKWKFQIQLMTEEEADRYHINPFDLTKVWPAQRFPVAGCRYTRTEPESGELFCRSGAIGVQSDEYSRRYRFFPRQDVAGKAFLLWRRPALPSGSESGADSGQQAPLPVPRFPPRRCHAGGRQLRCYERLRA